LLQYIEFQRVFIYIKHKSKVKSRFKNGLTKKERKIEEKRKENEKRIEGEREKK
jgi:hypothetical protein